ncbi:MAG TPA: VCBS repeat-containing protein [Anaeromyxobacteraceae bacterium]|nr:VCBS repeat-containing protein [Anaeromyxobacteraceae bacterium]
MRGASWAVVCAFSVGIAIGACGDSEKGCPSGQVMGEDGCVAQPICSEGATACGSICCNEGQTCVADGECRGAACNATTPCEPDEICHDGFCMGSDPACAYRPPQGAFEPRVAWRWEGSATLPAYRAVLMTPVVMPLSRPADGDASFAPPAVVFNAIRGDRGAGEEVEGVMRAVRGDDGSELWTSDPAHLVNGLAGIAAGDLDGAGQITFVTARFSGGDPAKQGLVAFDAQGRFRWEAIGLATRWGAPAVANLFGGARANVVIGATILDADGKIVCQGTAGQGSNFMGPISTIADVDQDGRPDIVTGNTVYGTDCQPKPGWPAKYPDGQLREDGLPAVADFGGDGHPEIVVVAAGAVRIHDWKGALIWGPVALPGGGAGGPPTIADFDGDGKPEIGVASRSTYSVLKPFAANPVVWSRPTQDHSDVTGSSVFDFENDGKAEVVYGDECYTRVYDGASGTSLFEAENPSCTTHENPVIADVDRDGRAEIVVATNAVCNYTCPWGSQYGSRNGITVWKDLRDRWVSTRSIWNQHAYHVTNVLDDGRLPWPEPDNWRVEGLNDFRMNPIGNPNYSAPNVTADPASDVVVDADACPERLVVRLRVWNRGAVPVAAGVPIAFHVGPVVVGRTATAGSILPGSSETVTFEIAPPPTTATELRVVIDDDGGGGVVGECVEDDNAFVVTAFCAGGPN